MASRGYLYRQKGRGGAEAPTWWAKYYRDGVPIRESTGTADKRVAIRFLNARVGKIASGEPLLARADKIRYEEAEADLKRHYETTGSRNMADVGKRLAHLTPFFTGHRIAKITGADVTRYVERRQREEAANGTVNRELAILTKMLRLAYENQKLVRVPVIHKLEEAAPRQGFFEREQYEAVRKHLRAGLQVAVTIAYTYGWRMQSEVLTLERRQVDLEAGTLRLDPGSTKNDDGRLVYLTPELAVLVAAQLERVKALERGLMRIIPYLFPHLRGRRRGARIVDFRKAWVTACHKAGVAGWLRHDLRRTAVRNLERAGVPRSHAMKVTGHRTESVYNRYAIVSDADLRDATARLVGITTGIAAPGTVESPSATLRVL